MALKPREFQKSVRLRPSTDSLSTEGEIQYNATDDKLKYRNASTTKEIVNLDEAQILTNKSIDADNNTITNIKNDEIAADADITRTKLAPGTASHVLINDGTGEISSEAQLAKVRGGTGADNSSVTFPASGTIVTETGTHTLTNKTIDGNNNTISNLFHGSEVDNPSSGVHGVTGSVVGTTDSQTLTNKTIDADNNIITNIKNDEIAADADITRTKLAPGTASHVLINDGSGEVSSEAQLAKVRGGTGADNSSVTFPATGVIVTEAGTQTLTNKTISDTSNTITFNTTTGHDHDGTDSKKVLGTNIDSGAATNGQVLTANGSGGATWTTNTAAPSASYELSNLSLACSVGSNALTIALKDQAGSDPSGGSPVKIGFRNSTAGTGTYSQQSVTSALSLVISSGSTLGHASSTDHYIYVYAIDTGSGVVLGASGSYLDEGTLFSSTAEGGAGAADDIGVLYSTAAQTSKPIRLIGRLKSNQTTAGTWAAVPTEISLVPFERQMPAFMAGASTTTITSGATTLIVFSTKSYDTYNSYSTSSGQYTVPIRGKYLITSVVKLNTFASGSVTNFASLMIRKNGSTVAQEDPSLSAYITNSIERAVRITAIIDCAKGDLLDIRLFHNYGSTPTLANSTTATFFSAHMLQRY